MAIVNGYATGDELADHLSDDRLSADDDKVERAIETASRIIDAYTKRRFYLDTEASSRLFLSNGYGNLRVDDFTELVSITPELGIGQLGTAMDSTTYRAGPLNAPVLGEPYNEIDFGGYYGMGSWGYVSVEAVWGWPSVPKAITQACLLKAARIYKRRESVTASLGFDEFALRLSATDPDVAEALMPYRWLTV